MHAAHLLVLLSLQGSANAQVPLTNDNFQDAVNACLAVEPVNGNCPDEPHGASKYCLPLSRNEPPVLQLRVAQFELRKPCTLRDIVSHAPGHALN